MPSSSGVRLAGDDFQHVFTWLKAMRCLVRGSNVERVEFEVREAGNVDDVVVHHTDRPPTYHQIKFVVDQRQPLTHEWFMEPPRPNAATPLKRFYDSFIKLGGPDAPPDMVLYTNRGIAPSDPLMRFIAGLDDRLVPRAFAPGPGTDTGQARAAWAAHLGIEEAALQAMLASLRIQAGEASLRTLQERCQDTMGMLGLRSDEAAIMVAIGAVRTLIQEGRRSLDRASVDELIKGLGLPAAPPRATLLIQCLEREAWPDSSTAAVDWVDLFVGDEPRARRQLIDPDDWEGRLRPELRAAVAQVHAQRFDRVLVTGTYRLSIATLAGAEMPRVAGFHVARRQGPGDEWSSDGAHAAVSLERVSRDLGDGEEVAVALAIAADLADDVEAFCGDALPSIGELVVLSVEGGPGRHAIPDADTARGVAEALVNELRTAGRRAPLLHLFQAAPSGLSLLLGHAWNRITETQLYDDLNSPARYTPTFRLVA